MGWSWVKRIIAPASGPTFPLNADDVVVFVVGPAGSGKSTFIHAATEALGHGRDSLQAVAGKVQVIRCELTDEARRALGAPDKQNIVFVDVPSFHIDPTENANAEKETSTWLKQSRSKSTRFGTVYLHRIEMDPDTDDQYRLQKQLDTFGGTFPEDVTKHAFPQGIRCVFTCMDKPNDEKITKNRETFEKQLALLRPSWGRLKWEPASIHPDFLAKSDARMAWEVVEKIFSP